MVSPRIQRWALTLSSYNYTIQYWPGLQIPQADDLSRLPLTQTIDNTPIPQETVLFLQMLDATPATSSLIRQWTRRDPILSKIINMVYHGHDIDGTNLDFKPYQVQQTELSIEEGILLLGSRVTRKRCASTRATRGTPRSCSNESSCTWSSVVAKVR